MSRKETKVFLYYYVQNDSWDGLLEPNVFGLNKMYLSTADVKVADIYDSFPLKHEKYYLRFFLEEPKKGIRVWMDLPPSASAPVYGDKVYVKALRLPKEAQLKFVNDLYRSVPHKNENKTGTTQIPTTNTKEENKEKATKVNSQPNSVKTAPQEYTSSPNLINIGTTSNSSSFNRGAHANTTTISHDNPINHTNSSANSNSHQRHSSSMDPKKKDVNAHIDFDKIKINFQNAESKENNINNAATKSKNDFIPNNNINDNDDDVFSFTKIENNQTTSKNTTTTTGNNIINNKNTTTTTTTTKSNEAKENTGTLFEIFPNSSTTNTQTKNPSINTSIPNESKSDNLKYNLGSLGLDFNNITTSTTTTNNNANTSKSRSQAALIDSNLPEEIIQEKIEAIVNDWGFSHTERKNLRLLLASLREVWVENIDYWEKVNLKDLLEQSDLTSKIYRRAMLELHPDKNGHKEFKIRYLAEKLFLMLNKANEEFSK